MRIGLNLLHAMPGIGGGWNYIRDLVRSLLVAESDNHYVVFVTDFSESIINGIDNITIVKINVNSSKRINRLLFENTLLQYYFIKYRIDCVHWFCNYHSLFNLVPSVVTIYDLQPFKEINKAPFLKRIGLRYLLRNSVKKSTLLLPMSNATRIDLRDILSAQDDKMIVIPPILNPAFNNMAISQLNISELRLKYKLPDNYWVYVAHYYPHKNHLGLLQAYSQLIRDNGFSPWPLVFRGDNLIDSDEIMSAINELKLNEHVTFLPRLEENEISLLYAAAGAMVFPSLYEGGGIPVLEAMACGCPVLSSRLPSILEYAGDAISYFDVSNSNGLAFAMRTFQEDVDLRAKLVQKGFVQVQEYAADKVVAKLLTAYKNISNSI